MLNTEWIQKIYNHIPEKESKLIYIDRLNYSLTKDITILQKMVDRTVRSRAVWQELCHQLHELSENQELVIFGAGIWGKILYEETKSQVRWKNMIDSNPKGNRLGNLSVIAFDEFVRGYNGEMVVISSFKVGKEMIEQLRGYGIPDEKIVDAGKVIYELTEKGIYFDLQELLPLREWEVFVDAGCYDGLNTKNFYEWCKGKGFSYCMEPDEQNIERICRNLGNNCNYEVISKALWSKTTTLSICAKGNFSSSVVSDNTADTNARVQALALDDFLYDKDISYIKMDIEGAELEALRGARRIIQEKKPRLAISIYHKLEDIWTIPCEILDYCSDYRFYLRHYSFSDYDTVLYAIP